MKKELCVKLVIYKDYTEMHGKQNIKLTCRFIHKQNSQLLLNSLTELFHTPRLLPYA